MHVCLLFLYVSMSGEIAYRSKGVKESVEFGEKGTERDETGV